MSLCAFDTFLTYVLVVHCALLADLTTCNTERNQLNNWSNAAALIGSLVAATSYR